MYSFVKKFRLLFFVGFCFILVSCSSLGNQDSEPKYQFPIASYNHSFTDDLGISLNFFDHDTGKGSEEKYAELLIHHFKDSSLSIPNDVKITFQIEGTDVQGEAQLDMIKTISGPEINSDKIQNLIKNREPMTLTLTFDHHSLEFELIYRTPSKPS